MAGITYELSEDDAVVVNKALIHYSQYLMSEFEKIAFTPEISAFLTEAARKEYQEQIAPVSKLHVALAETFSKLRQE